ncbi:murein transglycosylase A [Sphingomonas morindae]|uniref:peptidoglycan lytic exotransglycosylase n=1 Tax=Sphingomonas morindae TaxID=1541170 RepID=A0ABY4XAF8_9SPHN|nr:murein transglycosylase A [Sphingomonas morindae]USI73952.1 murein transglycosylase A [Sphingomonas morindae]
MIRQARAAPLAALLALAACVSPQAGRIAPPPVHPAPPAAAPPPPAGAGTTALQAGVAAGPALASLPIDPSRAGAALAAFRLSCPALVRRTDASGLTRGADWQPACAAASGWPDAQALAFFARFFETARIGDGQLFATGYYEPEIAGSATPQLGYDVPIYGVPDDLVEADLGQFSPDLQGRKIRGRIDGRRLVPYPDRRQIEEQGLGGHAPILGYAADPIAFFFLQIQGSGRVRLADGGLLRIGYAGQNGQSYTGIGKWMLAQGLLAPGQASMQGIVGWLHAHPDQAAEVMRQNRSYVFFKPLTGPGPLGALGVPVTGGVSVAADPRFVPLGAPLWLSADRREAAGLWIAQDTGGAIKGPNRVDTFWGAGAEAERVAGGMAARGTALLLLPQGTLARLGADARPAARS